MSRTYDCYRDGAVKPQVVRGFINLATGRPATCDTEVTLAWEDADLVLRARCWCDAPGVSAADRLVITFDPAGREADRLQVAVAPDGSVATSQCGTAFPHTRSGWILEPYPFPAAVETTLANDGWRAVVRLPLAQLFASGGGVVPDAFRLNLGRIADAREWSTWPLADATFDESLFAFPLVRLIASATAPVFTEPPAVTPALPPSGKALRFRGLRYDTSGGGKIPDVETLVRFVDWLAVCGCTHFMLYFENGFRYRKHPAFAAPDALDADAVRRIDGACRERGIELILAQATLGHLQGVLAHPAYLRLAEDGDPYQLCPAHPDAYPFLGDLLDELIPLSESEFFNVSCDESRLLGRCPRCRTRGADARGKEEIFLDHLLWLYAEVSGHGRRMMVASDHLLHMPAILDRLPKDIVILDRQHHNAATFPTVTFLRARGFEVIGCAAGRCDHLRALIVDGRRRGLAGVLDTVGERADRPLCLAAPGIYLMDRLARGEPSVADDTLLAAAEELIWPGNAPGIAWRMLIDHHDSLPPALRAKVKADAALALRRAVPYRRFAWIAEELRRLLEA